MENQRILKRFQESLIKDNLELETEKQKIINSFKGIKKSDLFPKKEKLTLWQKLRKILNF